MGTVVEGVLGFMAADRNQPSRDLLGIWNISALELSAHAALRSLCDVRLRNRSQRCVVHISVAGQ